MKAPVRPAALLAAALLAGFAPLPGQEPPPVGREVAEALTYPPLRFHAPEVTLHRLPPGVDVLHLEDPSLPLVDVLVRFRGGYAHLPRGDYAATVALSHLLRNGGTVRLAPDSVDALLDEWAVQTAFGGGGQSTFSSINVLTRHLEPALRLWGEMLREPRFDAEQVEVWRLRQLENARRRADDPVGLAYSAFNHLMYGDHPTGWEMAPSDLDPADVDAEHLAQVHRRVICPGNMVLGVAGDVSWAEVEPLLLDMLEGWPTCSEPLPEPPLADLPSGGGLYLVPRELNQSTVVMAHPTDVRLRDESAYFASRIGSSILGGSGFQNRLMARLRTEEGYAYSASSLWTAPRESQGLVGAVTRTRSGTTVAAIRAVLEEIADLVAAPPAPDEVRTTVDQYANGFVFNFDSPAEIVSRRMTYLLDGLPADWLQRFLSSIQEVSPEDVHRVFRDEVRPEDMVILVVGDPDGFDEPLEGLGPVTILDIEAGGSGAADRETGAGVPAPVRRDGPSGGQRSRR